MERIDLILSQRLPISSVNRDFLVHRDFFLITSCKYSYLLTDGFFVDKYFLIYLLLLMIMTMMMMTMMMMIYGTGSYGTTYAKQNYVVWTKIFIRRSTMV